MAAACEHAESEPLMASGSPTYGSVSDDAPTGCDVTDDSIDDDSLSRHDHPSSSTSSSMSSLTGSQDSQAEKPAFKKAKKIQIFVFIFQVICLAFMAGSGALYLYNHFHRWGQCLMTAYYMPGGILTYSKLTIWCDVVAHVTLAGSFLILSMMTVNWFAGIRASLKCIRIELGLTVGATVIVTLGCATLIWNLKVWCNNLATSVQCQKGDASCPAWINPSEMSCHNLALEFDAKNYSKYDNMLENYESMTEQTGLLVVACLNWIVLTVLMSTLLYYSSQEGGTAGLYRLSSTKYTRPIAQPPPLEHEHTFPYNDYQSESQESRYATG
ncbi:hypothetical protein CAPTEDRAFT_227176 [Capitella teleta]|uniref:Uncharacterized protein n=1 Tax=Capitella teleta TaxID=283909 RepID=R7UW90_CAPTE|nr:hypothetical protein CAPTEDRAFT_227176 [Capitella teleta]|eukprot:ELU07626.1 hypothetical protein CAPTEDRAFT_227176 [Capitella teleta]